MTTTLYISSGSLTSKYHDCFDLTGDRWALDGKVFNIPRFLEICNADDAERAAALARPHTAPVNSIQKELHSHHIDPAVLEEMQKMMSLPDAGEALGFVQARRSDIDRACNFMQILPPPLVNKSDAVIVYYHCFTEAFIRLHSAATVIGSQLVTVNSRAADQASNLKTVLSYLPDSMKTAAAALPLPVSAVMTVLSSIWIYRRDNIVNDSLYAFSQLLRQQDGAVTLVAKEVALSICLQHETVLNHLATDTRQNAQTQSFPQLREKLAQVKAFAQKHALLTNELDQSPVALQALADLQQMQKKLVTLLGDDCRAYENLQRAEEKDKALFLLQALDADLRLVDASGDIDGNTTINTTTIAITNAVSNTINIALTPAAHSVELLARIEELEARTGAGHVDEPKKTVPLVTENNFNEMQTQVDVLQQHVRQLVGRRPPDPINITCTAVERGRQLQAMSIQLAGQLDRDGLFSGANKSMTMQQAIPMIFDELRAMNLNMGSVREDVALEVEMTRHDAKQDHDETKIALADANRKLIVAERRLDQAQHERVETRRSMELLENTVAEITAANDAAAAAQQARCCNIS